VFIGAGRARETSQKIRMNFDATTIFSQQDLFMIITMRRNKVSVVAVLCFTVTLFGENYFFFMVKFKIGCGN
jgi:hypothetical protein